MNAMTAELRWHWAADLHDHSKDVAGMLAASVADEGILGYAAQPTEDQLIGFVDGLKELQAKGTGHVLIGEDAEGTVAMCVLKTRSMPNSRHIAEVEKAYLSPRVRGTTAVFQLARQVCLKAAELGTELLLIDVREGSKAHKVWARLGFTTYGVLDDYVRVDGQQHRGHYMRHEVADLTATVTGRLAELNERADSTPGI
ncbi:N-acetyltransferase [Streptomyces yunnanensis]|nr:N-acetyltransferase [Streptomyces yunnanensis]